MNGGARRIRGILLAGLLLVPPGTARACGADGSASPSHHLLYGIILGYGQARDELLVPLRWGGPQVGLRLEFAHVGERSRHDWALRLPVSFYQNRFGHSGYGLGAELSYTFTRDVRCTGERGIFSLGGQLRCDVHDGYYNSWDDSHLYWLTAYSLGARLAWRATRNRWPRALEVTMDVPLLALVSRPAAERLTKRDPMTRVSFYFSDPFHDMRFETFPAYAALHAGVAVRQGGFILSYNLEWSTYDSPERVVTLAHRATLARRWVW